MTIGEQVVQILTDNRKEIGRGWEIATVARRGEPFREFVVAETMDAFSMHFLALLGMMTAMCGIESGKSHAVPVKS
jgi:hypothetical protein